MHKPSTDGARPRLLPAPDADAVHVVVPTPRPVAVRLRDLERFGLNRGHVRRAGWERLSQGLHARVVPDRSPADTAKLLSAVLPRNSGFGHLTSAAVRGWWLPQRLPRHVIFATTTSGVHVQRRGMYVRRSAFAEVELVDGIPVMTAPQTLLELARDLSLVDLVPMVDCALAAGADHAEILAAARHRARGSALLRRAVSLADPASESWWESVLRLQHTLTGLGPIEAQVDITADGFLVARADLHLLGTNRYPECDGGEHRTKERHGRDLARDKAMDGLGLERYGYTTQEIASRPEMVIRDAEAARAVSHDARRLRVWWRHSRISSLSPHGQTRLAARLRRYRLAANRSVARSGRPTGPESGQNAPLDAA